MTGQHARDIVTALAFALVIIGLAAGLLMHAAHLARRRRYNLARRRAIAARQPARQSAVLAGRAQGRELRPASIPGARS
jgi:hypothetical protein